MPSRPSPRSRVDEAQAQLRAAIEERRLLPGEPLRLDALSQQFDMSVQPIREAIRLLESEGLVERANNRGAVVAKMRLQEIIDLAGIRTVVEPMMTSMATLRATDDELASVRSSHDEITRLIRAFEPRERVVPLTIKWHEQIYACARSRHLSDFVGRIWASIRINSAWRPSHAEDMIAEHERIVKAMEARDAVSAAAAMRLHVRENAIGHIQGFTGEGATDIDDAIGTYDDLMQQLGLPVPGPDEPVDG